MAYSIVLQGTTHIYFPKIYFWRGAINFPAMSAPVNISFVFSEPTVQHSVTYMPILLAADFIKELLSLAVLIQMPVEDDWTW